MAARAAAIFLSANSPRPSHRSCATSWPGNLKRPLSAEELQDRLAFGEQIVGTALLVGGRQIVNAHGVVDRLGDVGRRERLVGGILGAAVAGTVGLAAAD